MYWEEDWQEDWESSYWEGPSFTLFLESKISRFTGINLYGSKTSVAQGEREISFFTIGGILKGYGEIYESQNLVVTSEGGIGYCFIPKFYTNNPFNPVGEGTSSFLISLGLKFNTSQITLGFENLSILNLGIFFNPAFTLAYNIEPLLKPSPPEEKPAIVKKPPVSKPSPPKEKETISERKPAISKPSPPKEKETISEGKPAISKPSLPGEKPKYPADLVISDIQFIEPSGNNALDGYENGEIKFKIENKGKGDAINVQAQLIPVIFPSGLEYEKIKDVGDIPSQTSKEISIILSGEPELMDGEAKFRIEVIEKYGFDAEPLTITFKCESFKPPEFIIADYAIDDDKEGDSYGNNDGIVQLGEAIEVSVGIQNIGAGKGEDVKASVKIQNEGENIFFGNEDSIFNLGEINPGNYEILKFFFSTNKRYNRDSVGIKITLSEAKGKYGKNLVLNLPVNRPTGKGKEIVITKKEIEEKIKVDTLKISVDVDKIPENSLTQLKDGLCVIFGIEEYKYKNAPPVSFATRDAAIFYEYAKKVFGISEGNIYYRINEDATKGEFDKVFGEKGWLKRKANPNSQIIVYFAGHGCPDVKKGEAYLIPYDIDPNYAESGVRLKEILDTLANIPAKSVVVFIDACFSGMTREGEWIFAGARPLISVEIRDIPEKVSLLTASSGSEISSAYPEMKHGLFTYYLLKGLGGSADLSGDKVIYLRELADYVKSNVSSKAKEMEKEQTPQFSGPDIELIRLK